MIRYFSGQDDGFDLTGYDRRQPGLGTTFQSGTNPSVLNPVGTATSTAYNVGQGMVTDSENLGNGTNNQFNQMIFSIEKVTVTADKH